MDNPFLLINGGLGTELIKQGFEIEGDPLWSARVLADNPNAIKAIHQSFLNSGIDVVTTASYQASLEGFCSNLGVSTDEAKVLIQNSVTIARESCNEFWETQDNPENLVRKRLKPIVGGSVGPYGACQHDGSEYTGDYVDHMSIEELMDWHRPRMQILVNAGVDLLAFETIPAQKEAEALACLIKEFPDTKCCLSFCCKDEKHTVHGEELLDAVVSSVKHTTQIVAVGVNCCSPVYVEPLLQSLKNKVHLPFVAYPNSGEVYKDHRWESHAKVLQVADYVPDWISAGARWIGCCCRTSPEDIAKIRKIIDSHHVPS